MSKIKTNNYDKSSTGTDIELICMYDSDMSQYQFKENIEIIQYSGYRSKNIGYYIDNGNVSGADAITFTVKGDKAAKVEYLLDHSTFEREEIETWLDSDIDSEIIGQLSERPKLSNCDDLNKYDLKDAGIEIVTNKNLIKLVTRGYSQGDYAEVYYCPEDLEKAWGNAPKQEDIQKMIDHYYWDAPIYARFEINGEEYHYHDMPDYDEYEWEREKFIEYVAKESGIYKETIAKFVPEYPAYE